MKLSRQTIRVAVILSILLFIVGLYTWGNIFVALLPIVGAVKYLDAGLSSQYINMLLFCLTLALIPIATILVWKLASIVKTNKKILTVCLIFAGITVSVLLRREMIKYQARHIQPMTVLDYSDPRNPHLKALDIGIPVSTINFEGYALAGLVAGAVISFFAFRPRPK